MTARVVSTLGATTILVLVVLQPSGSRAQAEVPRWNLEASVTTGLETGRAGNDTVLRRARSTVRVGLDREAPAELPLRVGASLRLELEGGFFVGIEPVVRLSTAPWLWLVLRVPIWLLPHSLVGLTVGAIASLGKLEMGLSAGGYALGSDLPRGTGYAVVELSVGGRFGF